MKRRSRVAGRPGAARALATATVLGTLTLASTTLAGPAGASTTSSHAVTQEVRPLSYNDCVDILETYGYTVTPGRAAACGVAALGLPTTEKAFVACVAGLIGTRVGPVTSSLACTAGAYG
jgi:hypothetical protein